MPVDELELEVAMVVDSNLFTVIIITPSFTLILIRIASITIERMIKLSFRRSFERPISVNARRLRSILARLCTICGIVNLNKSRYKALVGPFQQLIFKEKHTN